MSNTEFFPEFESLPYRDGFQARYKLFSGHAFKQVPGRVVYPTSDQAEAAARAYLAKWLNPKIEAERRDQAVELTEFEAWRRRRDEEAQDELNRVFGTGQKAIVRNCCGGDVVVEKKRKRGLG